MTNDEKKFLDSLSEVVKDGMDFNEINNDINYNKYKKVKKNFKLSFNLSFTSLAVILVVSLLVIINLADSKKDDVLNEDVSTSEKTPFEEPTLPPITQEPTEIPSVIPPTEEPPVVPYPEYSGFVRSEFEDNIKDNLWGESFGPLPLPPVIDGLIVANNQFSSSNEDFLNNIRTINYVYEVNYEDYLEDSNYIAVYIESNLANKIYEEAEVICDAVGASPLNIVDGSIVEWFYTFTYYNPSCVLWINYDSETMIESSLNNFLCVGVYKTQKRTIKSEIVTATNVNITDYIYTPQVFTNDGSMYLLPTNNKVKNHTSWFGFDELVTLENYRLLFDYSYSCEIECDIDLQKDEITLYTYALQDDKQLSLNSNTVLNDFYISTNAFIISNSNTNKKYGELSQITYKYSFYIEAIKEFCN